MNPIDTAPKLRPILIHLRGFTPSRWIVGYWCGQHWVSAETGANLEQWLPDGWVELPNHSEQNDSRISE